MLLFGIFCGPLFAQTTAGRADVISIEGGIGPAMADYVAASIVQANQNEGVKLIIVRLNTPGGLMISMRKIIQSILASPIPVVGYVAPSGARAASAGTFILYATAAAAMAPGTHLGAAAPVSLLPNNDQDASKMSAMQKKTLNDAKASIRTLAEMHQRNSTWAERAVTQAATLTAKEALQKNVINRIAQDLPHLLQVLNGQKIHWRSQVRVLSTAGLQLHYLQPNWHSRFLMVVTNPSVTYLLLMVGLFCLAVEFFHPGLIVPGVVGSICILIALYALQMLPVSYIGLALLLLGVAFIVAEVFVTSYGVLGIGGVIALFIGSIMLIPTQDPGFGISPALVYGVPTLFGLLFLGLIYIVIKDRRRPPISNMESLIGQAGTVVILNQRLWLKCRGDLLQIDQPSGIAEGDQVRINKMVGARVQVESVSNKE